MTVPDVDSPDDAWRVARDLAVQAMLLRVKRDEQAAERTRVQPEPLPPAYDELMREAQVFALLGVAPQTSTRFLMNEHAPGRVAVRKPPPPPQESSGGPQRATRRQSLPAGQITDQRPTIEGEQR